MIPALPNEVCSPSPARSTSATLKPALGEVQRHAGADNAGAQNDRIGACHVRLLVARTLYMDRGRPGRYQGRSRESFKHMQFFRVPAALLSLAGRHGTLVVAASLFVGLFVPGMAAILQAAAWRPPSSRC